MQQQPSRIICAARSRPTGPADASGATDKLPTIAAKATQRRRRWWRREPMVTRSLPEWTNGDPTYCNPETVRYKLGKSDKLGTHPHDYVGKRGLFEEIQTFVE